LEGLSHTKRPRRAGERKGRGRWRRACFNEHFYAGIPAAIITSVDRIRCPVTQIFRYRFTKRHRAGRSLLPRDQSARGSRPLRWVQIALKPASKTLGLLGVFKRGKGLKYPIADSAFKRMQVDARARWLDADEHHLGLAPRTGGARNCGEWNGGRQALRLGHDASLDQAGAQHSLSPVNA
jgi:hypothetical protein